MAKIEIKMFPQYCAPSFFKINDVTADFNDFGYFKDLSPEDFGDYGCGNMQFIIMVKRGVQGKYGINAKEEEEIANMLDKELSFGACLLCRQ